MLHFFSSKKNTITDFSFLGTDMHNHVLPGLDDGSPDTTVSLQLVEALKALGFHTLIPSPHTMQQLYPNTPETIESAYQQLKPLLTVEPDKYCRINQYASEYMLDLQFTDFRKANRILHFGEQHVLVEMSYAAASPLLEQEIFELQMLGYQPILAHPERYTYLLGDFAYMQTLMNKGCQLQLNLLSFTEQYGKGTQKMALKMLEKGMYEWAGTDTHHFGHINLLNELKASKYFKLLTSYSFKNQYL